MNTNIKLILSHVLYAVLIIVCCSRCTDVIQSVDKTLVCDKDEIAAANLISVEAAHDLIAQKKTLILEVSKEAEYLKGHIPNALNVWRPEFRAKEGYEYGGMRCSYKELVALLQRLGMSSDAELLLYDAKGGSDAMRFAWVLDYYNFKNYQVINGGKKLWAQKGFALSKEPVTPVANSEFNFSPKINKDILADSGEVLSAIINSETVIIDTRESYEYLGQCFVSKGELYEHKKGAFARGCIPSAVHLNWSQLVDLDDDHRIKCHKDLAHDLAERGITKDKHIIVYCQSGSRSSHTAFVLSKVLGYPNVKNYDGSWIEWSYLKGLYDELLKEDSSTVSKLINKFGITEHTSQKEFEAEYARLENELIQKKKLPIE